MREKFMTMPQSNATAAPSLGRDVLYAARYYLGNRWTFVAVAGLAVMLGLYFGGWGWLVAAGLAPVLLSTLPCLVMCAFGVCMMCRSSKERSTPSRHGSDQSASSVSLAVGTLPNAAGCCAEPASHADSATTGRQSPSKPVEL